MRQELPDRSWLSIRNGDDGRDEGKDFLNFVLASSCYRIAGDGPVDRDRDTADAHYREVELVERAAEARAERSREPCQAQRRCRSAVTGVTLSRRGPRGECAMQRRWALRNAPHAAELQVVDDSLRHRLEPVVVAAPATLRPEVLRLAQGHLDGEEREEVFAGDRVAVVWWSWRSVMGARVAPEHASSIVAVRARVDSAVVVQLGRVGRDTETWSREPGLPVGGSLPAPSAHGCPDRREVHLPD